MGGTCGPSCTPRINSLSANHAYLKTLDTTVLNAAGDVVLVVRLLSIRRVRFAETTVSRDVICVSSFTNCAAAANNNMMVMMTMLNFERFHLFVFRLLFVTATHGKRNNGKNITQYDAIGRMVLYNGALISNLVNTVH